MFQTGFFVKTPFIRILTAGLLLCGLVISGCKDDAPIEPNPQDLVKASGTINGAYTTFTRSFYSVTPSGPEYINSVTFTRSDNTRIRLSFRGTEEGEQFITIGDTVVGAKYIDASNREYLADSGKIVVSDFFIRDGLFKISGGFEFNSYLEQFVNDTTPPIILKAIVRNGGFVDITN